MEFPVVVAGNIARAGSVRTEIDWNIVDLRLGLIPLAEGGRIGEGLEGRSWLACPQCHVDIAIDCFVEIILGSDHGEDLAGPGVGRDERGIARLAGSVARGSLADRFLGSSLKLEID